MVSAAVGWSNCPCKLLSYRGGGQARWRAKRGTWSGPSGLASREGALESGFRDFLI